MQQELEMTHSIKTTTTLALLGAIALLSLALARGISSDLHLPAARILVAECQGFEALATVGGKRMTCNADVIALTDDTDAHEMPPPPAPATAPATDAVAVPTAVRKKA